VTTERLYYTDSYLAEFSAVVVDQRDDGRRVYLDRTAFYPTSGGQPCDTGRLGSARVLDVVDEDDRIAHVLETPIPPGPVSGAIDWPRRFDHMQQHTGQHLLSAVLANRLGYQTVSVHFGAASATLDLDIGALAPDEIRRAESEANAIVTENRPVEIAFEDADAAPALRKAAARGGTIRVVTIRDLDRSACGGTHVRATGEIGPILIRKVERAKKQVRLEFLCGRRAIAKARTDFDILAGLAAASSAAIADLPGVLEKLRGDLKAALAARREGEEELSRYQARELYQATAPNEAGRRLVLHRVDHPNAESQRSLAQAVTALPRSAFVSAGGVPPALLVATSPDSGLDAGALLKPLLADLHGRGGGSARFAQASFPDPDALETALRRLQEIVRRP
jgi:alanyl-tRNA synthetase